MVTMDDATNEHYSMFFVPEEGTASSFQGVREVIVSRGLRAHSTPTGAAIDFARQKRAARWIRLTSASLGGR